MSATIGYRISQDGSFIEASCPKCRRWSSYPDHLGRVPRDQAELRFKCNSCGTLFGLSVKALTGRNP